MLVATIGDLGEGAGMTREAIKVLIVDDHPVFRDGLRQCLQARKGLRVVAAVGSGEEMWKALRVHGRPDIILMDIEMPGDSGIVLTRALRETHGDTRVVMLTAFSDSERVFSALKRSEERRVGKECRL